MNITIKRIDDAYLMESISPEGQTVRSDATLDIGGRGQGMRPTQMLLASLGSCSSIDVIELLRKQRQPLQHIELDVSGQRTDDIPRVFTDIHVHYRLYGELEPGKVERACRISMEKLCSITKMLEKAATITWSYAIDDGERVDGGKSVGS